MPHLVPITPDHAASYRDVRLRALKDSPSAFGSTYAREILLTDADWQQRSANLDGITKIGFLAMDASTTCGIVACFRDEQDPARAEVISMWVAPSHRGTGLSAALIDAIHAWATSRNIQTLKLMVTSNNVPAIAFYERYGFVKTGHTEPYPNDPSVLEFEMLLHLRT